MTLLLLAEGCTTNGLRDIKEDDEWNGGVMKRKAEEQLMVGSDREAAHRPDFLKRPNGVEVHLWIGGRRRGIARFPPPGWNTGIF